MLVRPWYLRHPVEAALGLACAVALIAGYASHGGGSATAAQRAAGQRVVADDRALPVLPLPAVVAIPQPPAPRHHAAPRPAPTAPAPTPVAPAVATPAQPVIPTPAPAPPPARAPAPSGPEVQVVPAG